MNFTLKNSNSQCGVHFNRTLPREAHVIFIEKPKSNPGENWRIHLHVLLLRVGGGMAGRVVISDRQIWQVVSYAEKHCCLRDRVIVRLLLTRGLRTNEIATLKVENIDWDNGLLKVFDSKKKRLIDIPVDLETLVMLQALLKGRTEGYVFQHKRKQFQFEDKPLTKQGVYEIIRRIACKAGVKHFNPRRFRQHLAAFWMQRARGRLAELQTILRHKNPQVTWEYANKFVFAEDVRREADRVTRELFKHGAAVKKRKEVLYGR